MLQPNSYYSDCVGYYDCLFKRQLRAQEIRERYLMVPDFNQDDHDDAVLQRLLQDSSWREQLGQYAGGSPAALVSLCEVFLLEVPALLHKIQVLTNDGNTQGLFKTVHTLKSCLNYVAPQSDVESTLQLELFARKVEASEEQLADFLTHYEPIRQFSRRWVLCVEKLLEETNDSIKER